MKNPGEPTSRIAGLFVRILCWNALSSLMISIFKMFPVVLPVLLISIGYVDPGKWVAIVEGGARFGFDLVVPMLLFNCAAILCQYLSARIGVVTGRGLAQICSNEYDKSTRLFLGVQAELSVVALDLTMVLGVAHGINLLFGMDLSTGVFLAALDAVLFPVFASTLGKFPMHLCSRFHIAFLCFWSAPQSTRNFYFHAWDANKVEWGE
ncbi:hypothetical protein GOBAR_DD06327 [Gossypium barbadense]|nr:hypothetical protein GOBAR_DD06327 [Gossypium barbadense]